MLTFIYVGIAALSLFYGCITPTSAQSPPLPPSIDPFYLAPKGYANKPAGSILRHRKLSGISANISVQSAYQFLYRTSDSQRNPSVSVTTVLIPPQANFSQHLSYQTYYDEADPDCSPSYGILYGTNYTSTAAELEAFAAPALQRGIPVSTSDYEGEQAAYTVGPQAAFGVLDSIRAVLASESITGIKASAQTVMFGYSGGSIATEWASEYQHGYAPELAKSIIGAALGGLPVNLTSAFYAINGSISAGLDFAALQGLANGYPAFRRCLEKALVPAKAAAFHQAHYTCNYLPIYPYQDVTSYFKAGAQFLHSPCWLNVVNKAGIMGKHGTPKSFPLYIYKGTADEIVPSIQQTDALVQGYCNDGAQITYLRYVGQTHTGTALAGAPGALGWIFGLFGGAHAASGCSVRNVTMAS